MSNKSQMYMTVEGECKKFRPIGYCHLRKHKGYIDGDINERHGCIRKKCLFLERCKTKNESVNKEREKLLKDFTIKVKELFHNKEITSKEYYKLIETKSDLYAQRFLNELKRGIIYTSVKTDFECDDRNDDYLDVYIEKSNVTIKDIVSNNNLVSDCNRETKKMKFIVWKNKLADKIIRAIKKVVKFLIKVK